MLLEEEVVENAEDGLEREADENYDADDGMVLADLGCC